MEYTLIGYTGFIGSNIADEKDIVQKYNSKNIDEAFNNKHDVVIYAGVRAEKYLANNEPEKDMHIIENAINNIKKMDFKKLILISTVDVYKSPVSVNEETVIDTENLHPYGLNRFQLEQWVAENVNNYHIIRLPGLFGKNIKKNFIFDMINIIPSMLKENLYSKILADYTELNKYYIKDSSFYKLKNLTDEERKKLRDFFEAYNFNALYFTDSRNDYQFYNLANLWKDIQVVLKNNIKLLNITTEPINTSDLYKYVTGKDFVNVTANNPVIYNIESIFAKKYYNHDKYLYLKEGILKEIKEFIMESR